MSKRLDKNKLVSRVATRLELDSEFTEQVIDATLDEIYQSMAEGTTVSLRNFGTFFVKPQRHNWIFKFNPSQKWRKLFGWSSSYKGEL